MAPVNADVAEVEAQLSAIRRRRNGVAAQRALAAACSTTLVAGSLMIATALRGSTGLFVLATTLASGGTIAAVGYIAWLTWHDWLSIPATARLADTRAALDDRLTTLLAVAPRSPMPPLRPLLLDQVIHARPRWGVDALAPRRFSPWLALVPLALAVFAATTFYARPPAAAANRHSIARTSALSATAPDGAATAPRSAKDLFNSEASPSAPMSATGAADRLAASGSGAPDGASATAGGQRPLAGAADGGPRAGGALDRLRESIQDTFGGGPRASVEQGSSGAGMANRGAEGTANGDRPGGTSSTTGKAGAAQRPPGSAPASQQANAADRTTTGTKNTNGNGRGGAANGGTTGVLGSSAAPRGEGGQAAPVAIKLSAITGMSPSQTEPQQRGDLPAAATNASRAGGPLPALADEQLADATVRPLDVGPEHEAIIRRIFTRE